MEQYSRRDFLRRTGCTAASAAAIATGLDRLGMVNVLAAPSDYRALVCVFMSGGNDSHNMIIPLEASGPFDYAGYQAVRGPSGLAIPSASLLPIQVPAFGNAMFGLHPSLGPATAGAPSLQGIYTLGKLAVVASGISTPDRL